MKKLITIIILFFACISIYGQNDFILLSMIIDLSRGIVTINKNDVAQADN